MKSKAQKAALALIEEQIQYLSEIADRGWNAQKHRYGDTYDYWIDLEKLYQNVDAINRLIEEHSREYKSDNKSPHELRDKLHDAIEKIYDRLMKDKSFEKAVAFAKKYGL